MEKTEKKSFVFNLEWMDVLEEFTRDVRLEVLDAIIGYAQTGRVPEMKPLVRMAFAFIRKEMDYNESKYEATRQARAEAGRKGMAGRWGAAGQAEAVPPDSKSGTAITSDNKDNKVIGAITSDNKDNLYVNDNVNVNDNVTQSVCVSGEDDTAGSAGAHTPTHSISDEKEEGGRRKHAEFLAMLRDHYPTVARLRPPSYEALCNIFRQSGKDWRRVWEIVGQMENSPDLLKKNRIFTLAFKKFQKFDRGGA